MKIAFPSGDYKVFLWFFANRETETTYKIYAIARDLGEARRVLNQMPLSPEMRITVDKTSPMVFRAPWAEVNVSAKGKAASWSYGEKLA